MSLAVPTLHSEMAKEGEDVFALPVASKELSLSSVWLSVFGGISSGSPGQTASPPRHALECAMLGVC